MSINLNIYALIPLLTLLQGCLFALLLILRGYREDRYADYRPKKATNYML
ncbi:MAG: hypothetical protein U5L45_23145 [Saprospiraceae bacterium]|nr:hypothetical protein [Saprospiraceae bacterium]